MSGYDHYLDAYIAAEKCEYMLDLYDDVPFRPLLAAPKANTLERPRGRMPRDRLHTVPVIAA